VAVDPRRSVPSLRDLAGVREPAECVSRANKRASPDPVSGRCWPRE